MLIDYTALRNQPSLNFYGARPHAYHLACVSPPNNHITRISTVHTLSSKIRDVTYLEQPNPMPSKLNNTPEILFHMYQSLKAFISHQFQAKRFETSQTTYKLIKIYSNAYNLTIFKNSQLARKVDSGAYILESDETHKI